MSNLTISLPDSMKEFVDVQVSACGFDSASAYVRGLIERAQIEKDRAEIDAKLLEALMLLSEAKAAKCNLRIGPSYKRWSATTRAKAMANDTAGYPAGDCR